MDRVAIAAGLLYGAVRVSPLGSRATITIVVLLVAFAGMVIAGVSGQALSPARHLTAIIAYHRTPKRLELLERPDKRGLVLDRAPPTHRHDCRGRRRAVRGRGAAVSRVGSLGDLLPISLVEPDGLMVTTDGRYVRLIECEQVPNTITADPTGLSRIEDAFAHLCRIIPDRQSLVIYAHQPRHATGQPMTPPAHTPPASRHRWQFGQRVRHGAVLTRSVGELCRDRSGRREQPIVARSGLGITPSGDLVWAAGHDLSVRALAQAMSGKGVIRALELDINPRWVAGYVYEHSRRKVAPMPIPLVPGQTGIPIELLTPYFRDFFTVIAQSH